MPDKRLFVAAIVSKYGRRIRQYLGVRVRNAADASDLAQEVFLRLLRLENHEAIRSPEAYLFTVASHVLHQHSLRQAALPESVDIEEVCAELQSAGDDPEAVVHTQQRMDALKRALDQLPAVQRSALLLHRMAGYSIEEIGEQLGVARPTAKKYLARALVRCRELRLGAE
jgi:RNA polymerase sigma-70 factor (ECF subfamily)